MPAWRIPFISFVLSSLILSAAAPLPEGMPPSGAVNGAQSQMIIKKLGSQLVLLDVRTAIEFAENHFPGAVLISVLELEQRLDEIPAGVPVLVICRVGRRAAAAYGILRKARPEMLETGLWYFNGRNQYRMGGKAVLK
jgi:rhodanese-related sulfurtransferase